MITIETDGRPPSYGCGRRGRGGWHAAFGAGLIVLGGLLLLRELGVLGIGGFAQLWPVLLIAAGIGDLFWPGRRSWGVFLTLAGCLLLADRCGWASFQRTWPLFLVAAGLASIAGGIRGSGRREPTSSAD